MNYTTLNFPGTIVPGSSNLLTGIRRKKHDLYITGFYVPAGGINTVSYLYKGSLENITNTKSGGYYMLNYPGTTTESTNLYGPTVLKHGNVRIVGNYTSTTSANLFGCMYQGNLSGDGKWKTLTPTSDTINTICHSTMHNLVVGNYDTKLISGKAFIFDIKTKKYIEIVHPGSITTTAYGVWYNGENNYTICGGYSPIIGTQTDIGYIVNYNSVTKKFKHWKDYYYNNDSINASVTHFDGITKTKHGYNLTGVAIYNTAEVGFFAHVSDKCHDATWTQVAYPGAITTTGNSVVDDIVIGVYTNANDMSVNGYIVSEI